MASELKYTEDDINKIREDVKIQTRILEKLNALEISSKESFQKLQAAFQMIDDRLSQMEKNKADKDEITSWTSALYNQGQDFDKKCESIRKELAEYIEKKDKEEREKLEEASKNSISDLMLSLFKDTVKQVIILLVLGAIVVVVMNTNVFPK